jgi:hypothetical protein
MAPIHLYLAAWVAGGVLLGASMLLDSRDGDAEDNPFANPQAFAEKADSAELPATDPHAPSQGARSRAVQLLWERARSLLPLGLIGFGLAGLTAKGLELDLWPWSFVCALTVGASLIGVGYRLSRSRIA